MYSPTGNTDKKNLSALGDNEAGFYFNWGDYILFPAS